MGWIVKDFKCNKCDCIFEELYKQGQEDKVKCPNCGSPGCCLYGIPAPAIGAFSMADPSRKKEILQKRSAEHTMKTALPEWREKQRSKVKK